MTDSSYLANRMTLLQIPSLLLALVSKSTVHTFALTAQHP